MTEYKTDTYRGYTINWYYDDCAESPREYDCCLDHMICWHRHYNLGDQHDFSEPLYLLRSLVAENATREEIIDYCKKTGLLQVSENPHADWEERYDMKVIYDNWAGHQVEYLYGSSSEEIAWDDLDTDAIVDEYLGMKDCFELLEPYMVILPISIYDHSGVTIWYGGATDRWDSCTVGYGYMTKESTLKNCGGATEENWREKAIADMELSMSVYRNYVEGNVFWYEILNEEGDQIDTCGGFYGDEDIEAQESEIKAIIGSDIKRREQQAAKESCEFWSCIA